MITLLEKEELPVFSGLSFMQTACLKAAFEDSPLSPDIWVQRVADRVCAVISRLCGRLYVSAENADFEELKEFIFVIGFSEIFTEKETALSLGLTPNEEFSVLKRQYEKTEAFCPIPPLTELYNSLKTGEDGDIFLPPFEDFATDVSHRLRHGGGVALLEEYGAALGFCSSLGGIVNGISVKKEIRGHGFGKKLLDRLCSAIGGEIYVATSDNTAKFYIKNGFSCFEDVVIVRG